MFYEVGAKSNPGGHDFGIVTGSKTSANEYLKKLDLGGEYSLIDILPWDASGRAERHFASKQLAEMFARTKRKWDHANPTVKEVHYVFNNEPRVKYVVTWHHKKEAN